MALTKIPSSLLDTSGGFDLQGNITLGANEEVQFGGASELKIFNDGTNSVLRSSDNLLIQRGTTPRSAITITDSTGEVALAYGGSTVFQTSSTGATVTGNLAVTGDLDITGNVNSASVTDLDVTDKTITLGAGQTEALSGGSGIIIDGSSASILWNETNTQFDINKGITVDGTSQFTIGSGENVNFYRSANSNLKIALGSTNAEISSAGQINFKPEGTSVSKYQLYSNTFFINGPSVGIGTSSPNQLLHLSANGPVLALGSSGTSDPRIDFYDQGTTNIGAGIFFDQDADSLKILRTVSGTATDGIILNASGNVGIGTNSPRHKLSVNGTLGSSTFSGFGLGVVGGIATAESDDTNRAIGMQATSSTNSKLFSYDYSASAGIPISIQPDNANVYICSGGGDVGINTTSPISGSKLDVVDTDDMTMRVRSTGASSSGIRFQNSNTGTTTGDGLFVGVDATGNAYHYNYENTASIFASNNTEVFRLRSAGDGIQFPDNNTFIATSNTAGGTAFEWGALRRPASSDGGQLTVRQYSSGNTAADYPAYASSNGSGTWDENTGMFFPALDKVGLSAAGNATLQAHAGEFYQAFENGFTSGEENRGQWACLGGIAHATSSNPGGSGSGTYLHIKTNVPKSNIMFRFEYKGQAYNGQNMDTSIIGYTYTGTNYVYSPQIQDTGNTTYNFKTPYYSSDNKLVLVVQIANNYTGGILWAQFCGSHTMTPGTVAIVSTAYSSSTSGAF